MDETPAYFAAVSLHLSRVLDEIGLNAQTVKRRRNTHLYTERLADTLFNLFFGGHNSLFHFGSQTEGTTTPGLHSDLDTLICHEDANLIESLAQWQPNKTNLLMLQEDTAPGYCRLQVLRPDVPMASEDLPDDYCTYDSTGRVILSNTTGFRPWPNVSNVRNGPARSDDGGLFSLDNDLVLALRCRNWPGQAGEFIRRRRRHGWPSPRLVQQAIKHGVFLVPAGHKLSQTEHLEWRISPSMAERCLMFSLCMVHIKCYVVLKMLIKTFVKPLVGKCISSYHCKTALLYCTENTEPGFWRDDNLLQCVQRCLIMLLTWVDDGFCPQFIISEENLFAGKVTAQNRDELKSIFRNVITSKGRALLRVEIDDINRLLQRKMITEPSTVPVLDSMQTVLLVGTFECHRRPNAIDLYNNFYLEGRNAAEPLPSMRCVCEQITALRARARCNDKHERQAIETYIVFLSGSLGSMMASFLLSHKRPVPRKAIQLLHAAVKCDVTSALKLASVLYSNGDLRRAEMLLQRVEDHFSRNEIQICYCYSKRTILTRSFCRIMYALKGSKARAAYVANCVRFSAQEIHCAPPALRNELHRSAGDDVKHRDPVQDKWMCLGVVDCLPFLFYLQYLTYKQLGKQEQRHISLLYLDLCVRKNMFLGHLETAWNLLGQCMEMEDDHDAALQCYITSLEVRPRNNAANWHVAILCYTQLKKMGLLSN